MIGDRVIYCSRNLRIPKKHGRPVLSDFGEAHFGSDQVLIAVMYSPSFIGPQRCYFACPGTKRLTYETLQWWPGIYSSKAICFTPEMQTKKAQKAITLLK
ncbi:protein kinase [Penicillium sp. IBT 18751x]|nr:protein kinase [Penicillium sp. IBT 18751x]